MQAQKEADFERRIYQCHARISDRYYPQPVCSLVVLADKSPRWRPCRYETRLWGARTLFEFPAVKLLDFRPRLSELESSFSPFALLVAGTLHIQTTRPSSSVRRAKKFSLLRNLYFAGLSREKIREFFRMIDRIMKLTPEQAQLFNKEVAQMEKEMEMPYVTSIERMALERGREEGREEGRREARDEALRQFVKALRERGDSVQQILQTTRLTIEELEVLESSEPETKR